MSVTVSCFSILLFSVPQLQEKATSSKISEVSGEGLIIHRESYINGFLIDCVLVIS